MTIQEVLAFLVGDERAMLRLAANHWTLLVGLAFVIPAGFARNYLRCDLRRRPAVLSTPLMASLGGSFLLYLVLWAMAFPSSSSFLLGYAGLLGLYWMTAPMAWLYAVPYEAWLSPSAAARARLGVLSVVALWRVALMARVLSVVLMDQTWLTFFTVAAFADLVAVAAIIVTASRSRPATPVFSGFQPTIVAGMGGIGPPDVEPDFERSPVESFGCAVLALGVVSAPFWLATVYSRHPAAELWRLDRLQATHWSPPDPALLAAMVVAAVAAAALVIWGQRMQFRRAVVERAFAEQRIEDALRYMMATPRGAFPFHWRPPASFERERARPWLLDVLLVLEGLRDPSNWVSEHYRPLLVDYARYSKWFWSDEELKRLAELAAIRSDGPEVAETALRSTVKLQGWYSKYAGGGEGEDGVDTRPPSIYERLPTSTREREDSLRQLEVVANLTRAMLKKEVDERERADD